MSLLLYASRRCPPLQFEEVNNYPITKTWEEVFAVGNSNPDDDSHLVKLIRAISNGKQITDSLEKQGATKDFKMHGDLWLKAANMGKFTILAFEIFLSPDVSFMAFSLTFIFHYSCRFRHQHLPEMDIWEWFRGEMGGFPQTCGALKYLY